MFQVTQLSRRHFLTFISLVAGVSAAGVLQRWGVGKLASDIYEALAHPDLQGEPEGLLGEGAVRALLATTTVLLAAEADTEHYAEFFRWRSENISGYRSLYERFAVVVDGAARKTGKHDFAGCDLAVRRKILQGLKPGTYALVFERDGLRFEKYIFQEIVALFSKTDAWIWLGYETWPGTPRGLQAYTKAPRKA
jgi:hypothetical protein